MTAELIILGCVAEKGREPAPAKDLYTSQLWRARRRYAEASRRPWMIFSAQHGLIDPDLVIAPYDATFTVGSYGRRLQLSAEACSWIVGGGYRCVEMHAGASYLVDLQPMLQRFYDVEVLLPLEGLGIGEQLGWYKARERERAAAGLART